MTATEELRRMLNERGVEWHDTKIGKGFITVYEHDCITWIVTEHSSGRLSVKGCVKPTQGHYDGMTPEQAIAATVGAGACEADETEFIPFVHADGDISKVNYIHVMECTECGHTYEHVNGDYEYCPRCGRKRRDFVE